MFWLVFQVCSVSETGAACETEGAKADALDRLRDWIGRECATVGGFVRTYALSLLVCCIITFITFHGTPA